MIRNPHKVETAIIKSYPIRIKIPPRVDTSPNFPGFLIISQKASLAAIQKFLPVKAI